MFNILLENSGLKKDSDWTKFVFRCLAFTFILHLIAAIRSSGFYHTDEHFQIVEFVNYKLGRSAAIELPLEYGHLMRPWLMSAIFVGLTSVWRAMGVESPFAWALGYRMFCSGLGFLSSAGLILSCYRWFPEDKLNGTRWRNYAALALSFIWYLPAFHARHSSENVSGSVFFIALSLLTLYLPLESPKGQPRQALPATLSLTIGALLGLAFEFRYQTGFMILGALIWLVVIAKISLRSLGILLTGSIIPVILGTLADRWGYGQWTLAPWNYLKYNIIQNHVSDHEVTAWWDYFRRALTESWPVLGFLLLISFVVAWIRKPKHLLTWSTIPLFLIHEIIGHKELRFLFPMIHVGPVLLIMSIQGFKTSTNLGWEYWVKLVSSRIFRWFSWCLVALNMIALIFTTILPAWSPIRFYEQLFYFKPPGFQLYYKDDSLFDFGGAKMNFYKPTNLAMVHINEYTDIVPIIKSGHHPIWLFTPHLRIPNSMLINSTEKETLDDELRHACQVEFFTLPAWPTWIEQVNPFGMFERITNWTLHRCEITGNSTPPSLPLAPSQERPR